MYACVHYFQACNVQYLPGTLACVTPGALDNPMIEFPQLSQCLIESVLAHALW
jgi:hypothetical protein